MDSLEEKFESLEKKLDIIIKLLENVDHKIDRCI